MGALISNNISFLLSLFLCCRCGGALFLLSLRGRFFVLSLRGGALFLLSLQGRVFSRSRCRGRAFLSAVVVGGRAFCCCRCGSRGLLLQCRAVLHPLNIIGTSSVVVMTEYV